MLRTCCSSLWNLIPFPLLTVIPFSSLNAQFRSSPSETVSTSQTFAPLYPLGPWTSLSLVSLRFCLTAFPPGSRMSLDLPSISEEFESTKLSFFNANTKIESYRWWFLAVLHFKNKMVKVCGGVCVCVCVWKRKTWAVERAKDLKSDSPGFESLRIWSVDPPLNLAFSL